MRGGLYDQERRYFALIAIRSGLFVLLRLGATDTDITQIVLILVVIGKQICVIVVVKVLNLVLRRCLLFGHRYDLLGLRSGFTSPAFHLKLNNHAARRTGGWRLLHVVEFGTAVLTEMFGAQIGLRQRGVLRWTSGRDVGRANIVSLRVCQKEIAMPGPGGLIAGPIVMLRIS